MPPPACGRAGPRSPGAGGGPSLATCLQTGSWLRCVLAEGNVYRRLRRHAALSLARDSGRWTARKRASHKPRECRRRPASLQKVPEACPAPAPPSLCLKGCAEQRCGCEERPLIFLAHQTVRFGCCKILRGGSDSIYEVTVFPAVSVGEKCHSRQQFLPSQGEWGL